jgi:hypothetical protein
VKHAQGCPIVDTFIDLPQPGQRFLVISKNLIRQQDDSCDAQHTVGLFDRELFSARFSVFQGSRRDDYLGNFGERNAISSAEFGETPMYCSKVRLLVAIS